MSKKAQQMKLPLPVTPPGEVTNGTLADRVAWIRRQVYGETRIQFAKRTSTTDATIKNMEDGTVSWSAAIEKVASATGYTAAWIMFGGPETSPRRESDDA